MNTETIIKVIQKCIDDTKQNKLYWKLLSSNPTLEKTKPLSLNNITSTRSLTILLIFLVLIMLNIKWLFLLKQKAPSLHSYLFYKKVLYFYMFKKA